MADPAAHLRNTGVGPRRTTAATAATAVAAPSRRVARWDGALDLRDARREDHEMLERVARAFVGLAQRRGMDGWNMFAVDQHYVFKADLYSSEAQLTSISLEDMQQVARSSECVCDQAVVPFAKEPGVMWRLTVLQTTDGAEESGAAASEMGPESKKRKIDQV